MKIGPSLGVNSPLFGIEDQRPRQVGREKIGRELDAAERRLDGIGDRLDGEGLREARNSLQKKVAVREEAHQDPAHHFALPDDGALDLAQERRDEGAFIPHPGRALFEAQFAQGHDRGVR